MLVVTGQIIAVAAEACLLLGKRLVHARHVRRPLRSVLHPILQWGAAFKLAGDAQQRQATLEYLEWRVRPQAGFIVAARPGCRRDVLQEKQW